MFSNSSEDQQMRLLQSVITHTSDAVLITEANPLNEPGPRIVYVNEAFSRMTGYSANEVIGRNPRMLQGPNTNPDHVHRLSQALKLQESIEISLINYKKNGEEFWNHINISPVFDNMGNCTHFIAIERDITHLKFRELQKTLLADISALFFQDNSLQASLKQVADLLINQMSFDFVEIWNINTEDYSLNLLAKAAMSSDFEKFYQDFERQFNIDQGLPGIIWRDKKMHIWDNLQLIPEFHRRKAAEETGLRTMIGIPLMSKGNMVGVVLIGLKRKLADKGLFSYLFDRLGEHLGSEMERKRLEIQLNSLFDSTPDIICICNEFGKILRCNNAMINISAYPQEEIIGDYIHHFIHPEDEHLFMRSFHPRKGESIPAYYETRLISKTGQIKWIGWTGSANQDGLQYALGKDITDKKQLETLLDKATDLAIIGGWDIDLPSKRVFWSKMIRRILEIDDDFTPNLQNALSFVADQESRLLFIQKFREAFSRGTSWDIELRVFTLAGREKWLRIIGDAEMLNGRCVRIFGSLQDINARKRMEVSLFSALREKSIILESIQDAFIALDSKRLITYWNNQAERMFSLQRADAKDKNIDEIFPQWRETEFFQIVNEVMLNKKGLTIESYHPGNKIWVMASIYPSQDGGVSIYFKDISETKQMLEALEESERRYSELFHLSPQPMFVYEIETGLFIDVNEAAIAHYGYSEDEFLKMGVTDIRPPEDVQIVQQILEERKKNPNRFFSGIFNHRKKDGTIIKVEIQSNAIRFKGKFARVILANDITERFEYIQMIEMQNSKFREIAWIQSHLVRAPLSRIMGIIELILISQDDTQLVKDLIQHLSNSANELDKIIEEITLKATRI